MTNDKLADEIERQLRSDGLRIQVDELSDASPHAAVHRRVQFAAPSWKQIIAALRERPQSVEMVMVPREPTEEIVKAMEGADKAADYTGLGLSETQRYCGIYRAMLAAAEAERIKEK